MTTFFGTDGIDTLFGSSADNILFGFGGNDFLLGLAGNDVLDGGDGRDSISGGSGMDLILGGNGNDTLEGDAGNDAILGEDGNDLLDGGSGMDLLRGGNGNDTLRGGNDRDVLSGGNGNDLLDGGNGRDLLSGEDGNDALRGGTGNDALWGGTGNDALLGEAGSDLLEGGDGDDVLDGDAVAKLFGLTNYNTLISFDLSSPSQTRSIAVTDLDGTLLGIDVRPADGLLYGLTDTNKIYTIDFNTGKATFKSQLTIPFNGGAFSGVDFNPVPDRLRVVGSNDENFRIAVDTGVVNPDLTLRYTDPTDLNFQANPNVTAAAYTNSFAPSPAMRTTTLYGIDTTLDTLVRQGGLDSAPPSPNDGQLFTIGSLGVDFDAKTGFDILSASNGINLGLAVSNSTLYGIDLMTGAATNLGTIGDGSFNFVGFAATVLSDITVRGNDTLNGGAGNDVLNGGEGTDTLNGGAGNDTLLGGAGNDILTGGDDSDAFTFNSNAPFVRDDLGVDRIIDFMPGTDKIVLDQTTFGAITTAQIAIVATDVLAATSSGLITYSTGTGNLFFNQNGATSGLGSGARFAVLEGAPILTIADFQVVA